MEGGGGNESKRMHLWLCFIAEVYPREKWLCLCCDASLAAQ